MSKTSIQTITIETHIQAPVSKVWSCWIEPAHITRWNAASEDWHSPRAENDVKPGGQFSIRMEAKDGSMGFDFGGTYDQVITHQLISYVLDDDRKICVGFIPEAKGTRVVETFDAETENALEMQQQGWLAILNNFKKYVESH